MNIELKDGKILFNPLAQDCDSTAGAYVEMTLEEFITFLQTKFCNEIKHKVVLLNFASKQKLTGRNFVGSVFIYPDENAKKTFLGNP